MPGLDQETALHMAAMVEDPTYLEILLRHGAPVDPVSPRGQWTPLFRAVQNRREAQIALLLRAGADLNRIDATGNSLLHVAAQVGAANPWVLRLLEAGVDPTLRNAQQKTFQPYFLTTPERLLNASGRETRAAVRAWLARSGIPADPEG
ncbi:MAG: ankyrin repeat domain-containing protein [Methylobacterium radiotolerans]